MKIITIITLLALTPLFGWEEDPRMEEYLRITDELLYLADEQTGLKSYEEEMEKKKSNEKSLTTTKKEKKNANTNSVK